jgi:zinc/manganese transport system substrate-binding protein
VTRVAAAVTAALERLAPEAATYLRDRAAGFERALTPYRDQIAALRATRSGTRYAATEPVFSYMAEALGFVDVTPAGFTSAVANESEPSPGDLRALEDTLLAGQAQVLIRNVQTEGSLTRRVRERAEAAGVPVVGVTETMPAGVTSFVDWQVGQLRALEEALR